MYNQIRQVQANSVFSAKALYILQGLTYAHPLHIVAKNANPAGSTQELWIPGRFATGGSNHLIPIACTRITNTIPAGMTVSALN
jgi:cytosine/uracil/thiamine/allantoin permease